MCSIMGYCSRSAAYDTFMKGFEATISRGPDDSRVIDTGKGYLGFHRLAIMGLHDAGMQPFQSDKVTLFAMEKYMDLRNLEAGCQESMNSRVIQIVK